MRIAHHVPRCWASLAVLRTPGLPLHYREGWSLVHEMSLRSSLRAMAALAILASACSKAAPPAGGLRYQAERSADSRADDDGDGVGLSEESADRPVARRFEALEGHPVGLSDLHEHAGRSAAIRARPRLVQQLPSERRPAREGAAARRRRRDVSGIQPPRRTPHQPRRSHRRLFPAQPERDRAASRPRATDTVRPTAAVSCRRRPRRKCSRCPRTSRGSRTGPRSGRIRHGAGRTRFRERPDSDRQARSEAAARAIFNERCTSCHGADGQGVQVGDKKAGPLWGPDSWNDGAGAARIYTLAGHHPLHRCRTSIPAA